MFGAAAAAPAFSFGAPAPAPAAFGAPPAAPAFGAAPAPAAGALGFGAPAAPASLLGGYSVGDTVYYIGKEFTTSDGDTITHGQRGVVEEAGTQSRRLGDISGTGLGVRFPGASSRAVGCLLTELSRSAPTPGGSLGAPATAPQSVVGNGGPPFQVTRETDAAAQASGKAAQLNYFSITNMPQYAHKSFEELRCENYSKLAGTKEATPAQSATSASTEILVKSVAGPTALKPDSIRDKLGVYVQTAQQHAGRPVYDFVRHEEPLVAPPPVSDPGAAVPNTSTPPNPFAGLPAFLASSSSPPAFSIGNFGVAPGAPAPAAPSPSFAPKKLWFDGSCWRCGPAAHFDKACVLAYGACTLKCMCVRDKAMTADAITSTMWEWRRDTGHAKVKKADKRGGRTNPKLPGPEYHQISVRRMAASTNDATAVKADAAPAVDAELCGRLAHYYVHPGGQVTTYAETTWQSTGSVTWGEAGRVCRVIEQRREYLCICEGERKLWVRGPHEPEAETVGGAVSRSSSGPSI